MLVFELDMRCDGEVFGITDQSRGKQIATILRGLADRIERDGIGPKDCIALSSTHDVLVGTASVRETNPHRRVPDGAGRLRKLEPDLYDFDQHRSPYYPK